MSPCLSVEQKVQRTGSDDDQRPSPFSGVRATTAASGSPSGRISPGAIAALSAVPQSRLVRHSAFYRTAPMGPAGQPDYLNAAVLLETDLTPHQLLDATQAIELAHGRVRKDERWGPRT